MRSIKLCRGFFLAFLPGEGAMTVGSSAGGGSARFFPLRSVEVAVVVVLIVSAMFVDIGGARLKCEVKEGREVNIGPLAGSLPIRAGVT